MDFDMNDYVELMSEVDDLVTITNERLMNSPGIILDNIGYFVQEDTKTLAAVMFWTFLEYDRYYHFDVVLEGLRRLKKHINLEDVTQIFFLQKKYWISLGSFQSVWIVLIGIPLYFLLKKLHQDITNEKTNLIINIDIRWCSLYGHCTVGSPVCTK